MKTLILSLFCFSLLSACQQKPTQEEMDAYIKDYLDRNGVQFLDENIGKYLDYQREKGRAAEEPDIQAALDAPAKEIEREGMYSRGAGAEAPVHIVMIGDFEDRFSNQARVTIHALREKYPEQIRFSFRHLPLTQFAHSEKAARAVEAAGRQGKFWEFFDRVYDNAHRLEALDYLELAKLYELDVSQFKKDMESKEIKDLIQKDKKWANAQGIKTTPTFLFNGGIFHGARDLVRYERIVDTILGSKN